MKRLFSNGWVFVLVMLLATGAFADRKIAPNADCEVCPKTSADGTLDVNWSAETVHNPSLRDEEQVYHDGSFEGQIGCGGGCAFAVRFTADSPIFLSGLTIYTQGGNATAAVVSIYTDAASAITGPPTAPVAPGDGTALWESAPMDLTTVDEQSQFDIVIDNLALEAGDYYVVVWENGSGFAGIASDLQTNYLDRNWAFSADGWSTINDAVGGDPELTGNFGISALFLPQEIEGSYMTVDMRNVNFGILQIDDGAVTQDITFGNIGLDPYDITNVAIEGLDFTTTFVAPVTVAPGTSVTMDVTLTPTAEGAAAGTYTVTTDADNATEAVINASAMVFDGFPEYLVWNPSMSISGAAFTEAFGDLGYTAVESPDLFIFGNPLDAVYSAVFITLGIYPDNYTLQDSSAEVLALQAFADAGYPLYMEGGDTWAYDPQTLLHPYFGIDGYADGGADLSQVIGQDRIEGMDYGYYGGNNFMDHLAPLALDAYLFHLNPSDSAGCGIGHLPPGANTIGNSFEFGGLNDSLGTTTELLQEYLNFMAEPYVDIWPPNVSGVTTFTFTLDTDGPYTVEAYIDDNVELDFAILFYNVNGGTFSTASMSELGDGMYTGDIPGQPVGSTVGYYITGFDSEGNEGYSPAGAPEELYFFDVVSHLPPMFLEAVSGLDGQIDLTWLEPGTEAPALVECADFAIPALPFTATGTNLGMVDDFDVTFSDGEDVAYQLNVMVPSTYTITLQNGTDFDSKLEVFYEDCITTTDYYNDDAQGNLQSELVDVYLEPGIYLVVVDGFSGATGNYTLDIFEQTARLQPLDLVINDMRYELDKLASAGINITPELLSSSPSRYNTRELRELTNFGIYRSETSPVLIEAGNQIAVIDTLPMAYTDFPLTNGTTYYYRVSAIYDDGEAASTQVAGVPMNHPPVMPLGLVGSVDDANLISLDWDDNTDYDLAGYYVYKDGEYLATVTESAYTETVVDGAYTYVVSSFDTGDMESEASERVQVLVGAVPPTQLRADGVFDDHIELVWVAPGNPAPPLLDCGDELVPGLPFVTNGSTVGMGNDFDVSGTDNDDYAYQLFMPTDGTIDITLCGPNINYDAKVEIFNGDCFTSTGFYDDDGPTCDAAPGLIGPSEILGAFLPEGVYLVVVDGFSANSGEYDLTITESGTMRQFEPESQRASLKKLVLSNMMSREEADAILAATEVTEFEPQYVDTAPQNVRETTEIAHYNIIRDGSSVGTTTETTYNDLVEEDMAYFYQVTAVYQNEEESAPTNTVEARANMAPGPPVNLIAEDTGHNVALAWQDPTTNMDGTACYDLEGIQIRRNGQLISTVDAFEWGFTDVGLPDGQYLYELVSFDEVPNLGSTVSVEAWVGPKPVKVQIVTDNYPSEISWAVLNSNNNVIDGISPGDLTEGGTFYEWNLAIEPGNYTFEIYDTYGDGIFSPGYYQVVHGVNILVGPGGDYDEMESTPFVVEQTILMGDMDGDGFLNILDVARFIEIITETGNPANIDEMDVMDINGDGMYNILDIVILIETILDPGGLAKGNPVVEDMTVTIPAMTLNNSREWQNIPVTVDCFEMVSGFQADLIFDPAIVELGIPVLAEDNESVGVFTSVSGNRMRVLGIDLNGNMIDLASGLLMNVPVQVIDENATGQMDFSVEDLIISGPGGIEIVAQCLVSLIDIGLPSPTEFSLLQNYPNPFNPTTNIRYDIAERSDTRLVIYNMLGQEVRTLVNGSQEVGRYNVTWNGLNNAGQPVATGIYIYHLQAGQFSETFKMAYVK